ncbi:MAG: protein-glutamate O-methyltransferase CheR [Spirochaetales bacterium]|nr:protein-glutamate O-methyltransferase CheR [Spirochaetales bacterium]
MSLTMTDSDFEKMKSLIYEKSGIHFSESNRPILESRLKERLKIANHDNISDYYKLITRDEEEMKILLDSVTTNLTRFFRNTAHMQAFEYYIIPEIVEYKKKIRDNTIKIWSAGCSTGEEPYTLAMILSEILPSGFNFSIVASDLSLKSLMTAKTGFYPDSRITGVPDKYLARYFEKTSGGYQIIDNIKKNIKFDYHNLKFDSGLKNLDIIFCRNVLIYFDDVAQESVVNRFWSSLGGHAYLVIGHSESLFGMKTNFKFHKTDWATFYIKMTD